MKQHGIVGIAAVVIAQVAMGQSVIVRVDGDVPTTDIPTGFGGDWGDDNAYKFLQDAIDRAEFLLVNQGEDVVEIWLAATTKTNPYRPDRDTIFPNGTGDRATTFLLDISLSDTLILGGFNGTETARSERDPSEYETVLSGDLNVDDQSVGVDENSFSIIGFNKIDPARLDGVTVRDANGGGGAVNSIGAAVFVSNCLVTDNLDLGGSGAGFLVQSGPTSTLGPTLINCVVSHNTARDFGGGLHVFFVSTEAQNCLFHDNEVVGDPIGPEDGSLNGRGAGIHNAGTLRLVNCTVADNMTPTDACGCPVSNPGCATHPECGLGGGIYSAQFSDTVVVNSILWGNTDKTGTGQSAQLDSDPTATVSVEYTDVQGGWPGATNIGADPQFVANEYRLTSSSPCIDVGSNTFVEADLVDVDDDGVLVEAVPDLDLSKRVQLGVVAHVVDMGAYEFNDCPWDLNGDGGVGFADLTIVLNSWGDCPDLPSPCPGDRVPGNGNASVGFDDLTALLGAWDACTGAAAAMGGGGSMAVGSAESLLPAAAALAALTQLVTDGSLTTDQFQQVLESAFTTN